MPIFVNNISIVMTGQQEVSDLLNEPKEKVVKKGYDHDLMIEMTDTDGGTDRILHLKRIQDIEEQVRSSLYNHYERKDNSDTEQRDPDLEKLERQIARERARAQEFKARAFKAEEQLFLLQQKVDAMEKGVKIGRVEVWSYDKHGNLMDHFILDSDDVDEEIPVANVVVTLRKEEPE